MIGSGEGGVLGEEALYLREYVCRDGQDFPEYGVR
jgi:hypothetical protein